MADKRHITWSPQGWLLTKPGERIESSGHEKLTFAQISYAIMDTIKEATNVAENVSDAIEKNKFLRQISLLKSSSAQYVSAGQLYNNNPTQENEKALNDADAVMGQVHSNILKLMIHHSENQFTVDPANQKQYLLKELEKALNAVNEWRGQIEMMQIDADAFYKAADRLLRAQVSIIKNVVQDREKQVSLAQAVKAWGGEATAFRDVFLPRSEKKWEQCDPFAIEDQLFQNLDKITAALSRAY